MSPILSIESIAIISKFVKIKVSISIAIVKFARSFSDKEKSFFNICT